MATPTRTLSPRGADHSTPVVVLPELKPEPGCMACVVDAIEWGWGTECNFLGVICRIVTVFLTIIVALIAIFSIVGIPFVFSTIYEFGARHGALSIEQVVRDKLRELQTTVHNQGQTIQQQAQAHTELEQRFQDQDAEVRKLKANNLQLRTLNGQLNGEMGELRTQLQSKGGTLKADPRHQERIKDLEREVARLQKENETLTEAAGEVSQVSLNQQQMAIAAALLILKPISKGRVSRKKDELADVNAQFTGLFQTMSSTDRNILTAYNAFTLYQSRGQFRHGVAQAVKALQGQTLTVPTLAKKLELDEADAAEGSGDETDSQGASPAEDFKPTGGSAPGPAVRSSRDDFKHAASSSGEGPHAPEPTPAPPLLKPTPIPTPALAKGPSSFALSAEPRPQAPPAKKEQT